MKDFDCYKSIGKCPRSLRCSAQLCPLDPEVEERVYLEGGPTCRLDSDRLRAITDDGFKEHYRKFIEVCLDKGARFRPPKKEPHSEEKVCRRRALENKILY